VTLIVTWLVLPSLMWLQNCCTPYLSQGRSVVSLGEKKKSNLKGSDARVDDRSLDEHGGRQPLLCQPHRLSAS
jgi:hypothetical protein